MPLWQIAVLAFAAMYAQDLLSTCMVVMESHYRAVAAGLFDDIAWLAWLASSGIAVAEIIKSGWRTPKSLTIIVAISAANFAGTVTGVAVSHALG